MFIPVLACLCIENNYLRNSEGTPKHFGISKKLVRLIKMCLTETYSRVRMGKNLSEMFPIRNGLKQGDALSPLFFNFALEYAIKRVQVN